MKFPYKHYCKTGNGNTEMFNVTNCEKCNREVTDVNAVGGSQKDIWKYKKFGMTERNMPFDELVWSDELGKAVCGECYENALKSPDDDD